jgi:hypothetical protein
MPMMTNTLTAERTQSAWTGREGAALLGLSGHQVGTIPGDTEVRIYDEVGSYTRTAFDGRSGFVLSESLHPERRRLEVADAPEHEFPERRWARLRLLRVFVSAGVLSGLVSAVLILV